MVSSMEVKVKGGAVGVKRKRSFGLRKDCEGQAAPEIRDFKFACTENSERGIETRVDSECLFGLRCACMISSSQRTALSCCCCLCCAAVSFGEGHPGV